MGTDKGEQTNNERAWDAHPFYGSMHLLSSPFTTTVALAVTPLSVRYTVAGTSARRVDERNSRAQREGSSSTLVRFRWELACERAEAA